MFEIKDKSQLNKLTSFFGYSTIIVFFFIEFVKLFDLSNNYLLYFSLFIFNFSFISWVILVLKKRKSLSLISRYF